MRHLGFTATILLLLCGSAFGQTFDLTIRLAGGETVTIPHDEILRILFADLATGVEDPAEEGLTPRVFQVLQNYPNPFNPMTTIAYDVPATARITVRIYDLQGALVRELLDETQTAGRHEVVWDGTDAACVPVAGGVYLYLVECGGQAHSRKLVLVK